MRAGKKVQMQEIDKVSVNRRGEIRVETLRVPRGFFENERAKKDEARRENASPDQQPQARNGK